MEARKYWPFPTIPIEEMTPQHKLEWDFLSKADHGGHRPYTFGSGNFGAGNSEGRSAEVIHRGGNRFWEILLTSGNEEVKSLFSRSFAECSKIVLDWLTEENETILQEKMPKIVEKTQRTISKV